MTDIIEILTGATIDIETREPLFEGVFGHATVEDLKEAIVEIKRLRNALHIIANDYVELSHDKVHWQRDDHIRTARKALAESYKDDISDEEPKPLNDDF
jgi:hypothetical protein